MGNKAVWILVLMVVGINACRGQSVNNSTQKNNAEDKIVVVRLDGQISESPPGIDLGLPDLQLNIIWDQLRLIRMLTNDDTVRAMVLLVNSPELNFAQTQQLAEELEAFRGAGKPIFFHSDSLSTDLYILALPADQIAMTPGAMLEMNGLAVHLFYYKRLMERLGIDAEIEHLGRFKLFAEPYTETRPSEMMEDQINDLLDSFYQQITDAISVHRDMSPDDVHAIIDQGPYMAERALEAGLIDQAVHRGEFLRGVQQQVEGELVYDYGKTSAPQLGGGLGGLFQLFRMLGAKRDEEVETKIAIVYAVGMIVEGESQELFGTRTVGSETMRKTFSGIQRDDRIKGVVMRIDSPGGSASASEIIWGLIHQTALEKPVIVSMGSMAASGGYYIASAGDHIFASPATLTGSIGVVSGKPVLQDLVDKIYIDQYTYTRGKNATMYDPFTPMTDDQRQHLRQQMETTLETFKDRVQAGRGDKIEDIDQLATGRIYTGRQGVEVGLVDQIGTLADAVALAAQRADVVTYRVVHLPEPKTITDILLESLGYRTDSSHLLLHSAIESLGTGPQGAIAMKMMGIDPAMIHHAIRVAKMLQGGKVLMVAPVHIKIQF